MKNEKHIRKNTHTHTHTTIPRQQTYLVMKEHGPGQIYGMKEDAHMGEKTHRLDTDYVHNRQEHKTLQTG